MFFQFSLWQLWATIGVSFCEAKLSSHSIVFYKLGDNHQMLLQILAECLKITGEQVNFYKARAAKVKLLHRCFAKVSLSCRTFKILLNGCF